MNHCVVCGGRDCGGLGHRAEETQRNAVKGLPDTSYSVDKLARQKVVGDAVFNTSCHCIGPQNGQPVCPCQMRDVTVKDGRYVRIIDLGPARGPGAPIISNQPKLFP